MNIKFLGIDFGSKYSYIVGSDGKELMDLITTSSEDGRGEPTQTINQDGYGEISIKRFLGTKAGISSYKKQLKEELDKWFLSFFEKYLKPLLDKENYNTILLNSLHYKTQDTQKTDIKINNICIGYPNFLKINNYQMNRYKDFVNESVKTALIKLNVLGDNFKKCSFVSEPMLALTAYSTQYPNSIQDNDIVLVVDLGGYTLDIAVIQRVGNKFRSFADTRESSISAESDLAGDHLNKEIYEKIQIPREQQEKLKEYLPKVDEAKCEIFEKLDCINNINYKKISMLSYQDKRNNTDVDVSVSVYLSYNGQPSNEDIAKTATIDANHEIKIVDLKTNTDFDTFLQAEADNILSTVSSLIGDRQQINKILFTGGGSGMSPFRKTVVAKLRENEKINENSFEELYFDVNDDEVLNKSNAVARGACLIASGRNTINIEDLAKEKKNETKGKPSERDNLQLEIEIAAMKYIKEQYDSKRRENK